MYRYSIFRLMSSTHLLEVNEEGGTKRRTSKKHSPILVGKVYAVWCGHCDALAPEWEEMERKNKKKHVKFVSIEETKIASEIPKLNQKYGVELEAKGFPTIFKIQDGKLEYYESGERTAKKITDWYLNGGQPDHYGLFNGGNSLREMRKKTRRTRVRKNRTKRFFFF